jgi:hypothetical protein
MAQAIQHLPSKCEILSSNPSTTKKKKKSKCNPDWEKIFISYLHDKGLVSRTRKNLNKNENYWLESWLKL